MTDLTWGLDELAGYTSTQLNTFFPDGRSVGVADLRDAADLAMQRLEYSLTRSALAGYAMQDAADFRVTHSDQYCMYLYLLSNTLHRQSQDTALAGKLFYLNKALHSFNCMYDTELPEVFVLIHVVGTVLGKASYGNYLAVGQNCTVGAIRGEYPVLGERVMMSAGSSIIGRCHVGSDVLLGPGAQVFQQDVPSNSLVRASAGIEVKPYHGRAAGVYFRLD